jgi:hypothetical protein
MTIYAGQIVTASQLNSELEIGKMVLDVTATSDSASWNSSTKVLTNLVGTFTATAAGKYEVRAKVGVEQSAAAYATIGLVYKQGGAAVATDTQIDGTTTRVAESALYTETAVGTFTAGVAGTYGVAVVGWIALGAATMNLGGDSSHSINRLTVSRVA